MKNIILVGHSHTNCLYQELFASYKETYKTQRVHVLEIANQMKKDASIENAKLELLVVKKIEEIVSATFKNSKNNWFNHSKANINIVLLLGGSFYHMLGLMKTDPPFDFVHPEYVDLELDDSAEIVPFNAVKSILSSDVNAQEQIIKKIKDSFSCNIFHLGFPPTVHSSELMMSKVEPFFNEKYEKPELAHHNLRFKLWRLYSDMYEEMCTKQNIPFIQVPDSMLENKMFLLEDAFGDSMHANRVYARNYIDQLGSILV